MKICRCILFVTVVNTEINLTAPFTSSVTFIRKKATTSCGNSVAVAGSIRLKLSTLLRANEPTSRIMDDDIRQEPAYGDSGKRDPSLLLFDEEATTPAATGPSLDQYQTSWEPAMAERILEQMKQAQSSVFSRGGGGGGKSKRPFLVGLVGCVPTIYERVGLGYGESNCLID
jgi:hypothetical protein